MMWECDRRLCCGVEIEQSTQQAGARPRCGLVVHDCARRMEMRRHWVLGDFRTKGPRAAVRINLKRVCAGAVARVDTWVVARAFGQRRLGWYVERPCLDACALEGVARRAGASPRERARGDRAAHEVCHATSRAPASPQTARPRAFVCPSVRSREGRTHLPPSCFGQR